MSNDLSIFIKTVLAQTNIVDVVQSRMSLKKAGSNYQGICPFHNEKTPSFSVNANKQFFYCFGCHASGDALNFVMRNDNLPLIEALELLAKPLGLALPERNDEQPRIDKKIFEYLREMTIHCRSDLDQNILSYLHTRGLSHETIRKFHLGYCGQKYLQWFDHCKQHKSDILLSGGVATKNNGKTKPKFFKRLMFPIQDSMGKIIGFGGRTLDDVPPKYLNSPETDIFKKRQVLYGLYQFRQLKQHEVIVVEGYMDCLALHSKAIPNVVACLGTAFTIQHWQLLKKYVGKIIFCFDGDRAGKAAAWKSLVSILPGIDPSIDVRFLFLPDGHDPDSYVKAHGKQNMLEQIDKATQWVNFFIDTLKVMYPPNNVAGKAAFLQEADKHISTIKNSALHKVLKDEINRLLSLTPITNDQPNPGKKTRPSDSMNQKIEHVIALLCRKDKTIIPPTTAFDNNMHDERLDVINQWIDMLKKTPELTGDYLLGHIQGQPLYEMCVQITQNIQEDFHPVNLQISYLSLRIELIEKNLNHMMDEPASLSSDEQSILQALIMKKKQYQQERHTLMSKAIT